jgi:hypothetical protein
MLIDAKAVEEYEEMLITIIICCLKICLEASYMPAAAGKMIV